MPNSETVEVRLARLETKLEGIGEQVVENRKASRAEHAQVQATLTEVRDTLNKWAGVRSGLLAIGGFMSAVAAVAGATAAWFFHKA